MKKTVKKTAKASPALRKRPAARVTRPVGGTGAVTSPKAVRIIERRFQVTTLRREGWTVQEIADSLGISVEMVRADLISVLDKCVAETQETTEQNRQLAIERLDGLLRQFYPMTRERTVQMPDPDRPGQTKAMVIPASLNAASMVLNIEARRAKLLALDKPETKKLDMTGVREYIGVNIEEV